MAAGDDVCLATGVVVDAGVEDGQQRFGQGQAGDDLHSSGDGVAIGVEAVQFLWRATPELGLVVLGHQLEVAHLGQGLAGVIRVGVGAVVAVGQGHDEAIPVIPAILQGRIGAGVLNLGLGGELAIARADMGEDGLEA